jgi:hypothetical protein
MTVQGGRIIPFEGKVVAGPQFDRKGNYLAIGMHLDRMRNTMLA